MSSERYSFSLTTFSPSGKLVQIEYALAAVAAGAPSVGIKASNGVVLATEKKHKSILYEEHSIHKVEMITNHIGMVYSGMGPDYRLLVRRARKLAQQYELMYSEPIPTSQLVQKVAYIMQEYTQTGGVRPFGVSLLVAGWDNGRGYVFQCDPSRRTPVVGGTQQNFRNTIGGLLPMEGHCYGQEPDEWQGIPGEALQ
ncbi:proteasome alpha2 subunit isoform X2 [Dermacentor variabilis]|uniref:proteasome alpha2 subunit isoform X2 n=1 Tax=Dermacentor variabilis TaxID=34621 RepID=UPI003F5C72BB